MAKGPRTERPGRDLALRTLGRLAAYLRPYWHWELLALLAMMLLAGLALAVPLAIQYLIDDLVPSLARATGPRDVRPGLLLGAGLIGVYLFSVLLSWLRDFLAARIGAGIASDLRSALFEHLEHVSLRFHHGGAVGEMMSRLLSDAGRVQELLTSTLLGLVANALLLVGVLVYLLRVDAALTLVALVPLPLTVVLSHRFGGRVHAASRAYQESIARLTARLQEVLAAVVTVRAFGQERHERERVDAELATLTRCTVRVSVNNSLAVNLVHFVNMVGPVVVLAWGTYRVAAGGLRLGELMAFYILLSYLYQPVQDLAGVNVAFQSAMASVRRVFEYLDLPSAVVEDPHPVLLADGSVTMGAIAFEGVRFAYEAGGFELNVPSLSIHPREIVAVVGPSGAGKTTLVNLVLRFFDPDAGTVSVHGIDARRLRVAELRGSIGVVEQAPALFRGSLAENIAYGRLSANRDAIERAAHCACLQPLIAQLEQGLDTAVGERGLTLSGGERQRVCLARALLRDPAILILDEATSALDARSEQLVQEALRASLAGKTALIIAHRLSTVRFADRILVMDRGRIVAAGTHDDLMLQCGIYRELAQTQLAA